jgi:hypothetical protein
MVDVRAPAKCRLAQVEREFVAEPEQPGKAAGRKSTSPSASFT